MIVSNLAVLLSERGLTAKKVSEDTGISRPTLTTLTQNRGNGIQYDTLNTLCNYLNVTPNDIVSYVPYEFDIKYDWTNTISLYSGLTISEGLLLVTISYKTQNRQPRECTILLSVYCSASDPYCPDEDTDFCIDVEADIEAMWDYKENPNCYGEIEKEYDNCSRFYKIYNRLPQVFKQNISNEIYSHILSDISTASNYDVENIDLSGEVIPSYEPSYD